MGVITDKTHVMVQPTMIVMRQQPESKRTSPATIVDIINVGWLVKYFLIFDDDVVLPLTRYCIVSLCVSIVLVTMALVILYSIRRHLLSCIASDNQKRTHVLVCSNKTTYALHLGQMDYRAGTHITMHWLCSAGQATLAETLSLMLCRKLRFM